MNLDGLAERTEGLSGADIQAVCDTAAMMAIEELVRMYPSPEEAKEHADELRVTVKHFEGAMKKLWPTLKDRERTAKKAREELATSLPELPY